MDALTQEIAGEEQRGTSAHNNDCKLHQRISNNMKKIVAEKGGID